MTDVNGSEVYLRTRAMRAFTLLDYLTHSVIHSPEMLCSLGLAIPSPDGGHCWPRRVSRKLDQFLLCSCPSLHILAVASHSPCASVVFCLHTAPWLPGYPSTSRIFPLLQGFFLQPRSSPSFQDHCLSKTTSYRNPFSVQLLHSKSPILLFSQFKVSIR